jgi:hypothetical protein
MRKAIITNISNTNYTAAIEAPDGTVSFAKSPRLINAYTTFSNVRIKSAKYYFDLELPPDMGEPLEKVIINQRQGSDTIRFNLDKTKAYLGTHNDRQTELKLRVDRDEKTNAISPKARRCADSFAGTFAIAITFTEAIPPGNNITIRLKPKSNPDFDGVYLFGVTAFPPGEKPYGLYLGAGRLQFYQNGDLWFR